MLPIVPSERALPNIHPITSALQLVRGRGEHRGVGTFEGVGAKPRADRLDVVRGSVSSFAMAMARSSPLSAVVNLIDLGSTNGTMVNGERITAVILRSGDEIQLGPDTVLHYSCGPTARAPDVDAQLRSRIEHALTKRELEVATLVARGSSNQRITTSCRVVIVAPARTTSRA